VSGYVRVPDVIRIWVQIVDPREVHIFMQHDTLSAVSFVECKSVCALVADDIFQVRELIVVENAGQNVILEDFEKLYLCSMLVVSPC
jgi:hypothetical protein